MYKLRTIAYHNRGEQIEGLTVPKEIAVFFQGVSFKSEISGTGILFTSGTNQILTKQEIMNYDFSGCKV